MAPDVLPDCTYCGQSVVIDIDIDGAVEVCTGCGIAQGIVYCRMHSDPDSRYEYGRRTELLALVDRVRRERRHQRQQCRKNKCECPCHAIDRPLAA